MVGSPCLGSPSTRGSINRLTEERWLVLIELLLKTRKVLHRQECRSSLSGWCLKVFEERWRGRVPGTSDHMPRLNLSELTTSLRAPGQEIHPCPTFGGYLIITSIFHIRYGCNIVHWIIYARLFYKLIPRHSIFPSKCFLALSPEWHVEARRHSFISVLQCRVCHQNTMHDGCHDRTL